MKSVNESLEEYRKLLAAHGRGTLKVPNENFDTGEPVKPGKYRLADKAYANLLDKLSGKPVTAELRANILSFYSDMNAPFATRQDKNAWQKVLTGVQALRDVEPAGLSGGQSLRQ